MRVHPFVRMEAFVCAYVCERDDKCLFKHCCGSNDPQCQQHMSDKASFLRLLVKFPATRLLTVGWLVGQ